MPRQSSQSAALPGPNRQPDLLDWGVLTETIAHEVNNVLNNILLHLAVLEQGAIPVELQSQTAAIRQKGREAAAMIKSLQQLSDGQHPPLQPIDLNAVVHDAVAALTSGRGAGDSNRVQSLPIRLELGDDLPPILGDPATLKRLVETLLRDADGPRPGDAGTVVLGTGWIDGRARMWLDYPGSVKAPALLYGFLDQPARADTGQAHLEHAIVKTLARRLRAVLSAELRADGGARLVVELQSAERAAIRPGRRG